MKANFIAGIFAKTISENKTGTPPSDYWPGRTIEGNGIYINGKLVSRFFETWDEAAEWLKQVYMTRP